MATDFFLTQADPQPVFDGARWIVTWRANPLFGATELRMARLTTSGQVLDPGGKLITPSPDAIVDKPAPAPRSAGGARVLWTDRRAGGPFPNDIYSIEVDGSLSPGSELSVSLGAPRQMEADVCWNGIEFLVVFRSESSGKQRILAQRLDPFGHPLDDQPLEVLPAQTDVLGPPTVAWNTRRFLVAWSQGGKARAVRLDRNLAVLDPQGFAVQDSLRPEADPAVSGSEGVGLVLASVYRDDPPYAAYRIEARLVDPCPGDAMVHGQGCPGSGGFVPRLALTDCPSPGDSGALHLLDALGGSTAILLFGAGTASSSLPGGCSLLVQPLLPVSFAFSLGGSGPGQGKISLPFSVPGTTPPGTVALEAFVLDAGVPTGFSSSNALVVTIP